MEGHFREEICQNGVTNGGKILDAYAIFKGTVIE